MPRITKKCHGRPQLRTLTMNCHPERSEGSAVYGDHSPVLSPSPLQHAKRNDRPAARASRLFQFPEQLRFQVIRIGNHLAARDLIIRRAVKTKLAHSQPAVRSHGRTKGAARHRPGIVQIAQSRLRIEHRTNLIVRKPRKALFHLLPFAEHARFRIPRKLRRQTLHRSPGPLANAGRPLWVCLFKLRQPLLQPHLIQLIDGKHAHATLRASRTARQPLAAAPRGVGQSSVHDLNQRPIRSRQSPQRHAGKHTASPEHQACTPASNAL